MANKQILFVSTNAGKIKEVRKIIATPESDWEVVDLQHEKELTREVTEAGETFEENATLKAMAYIDDWSDWILAEDSGVEVSALPDLLGVYSARWWPGSDEERVRELLQRLASQKNRMMKYVSVVCLVKQGGKPRCWRGELLGQAAYQPSGKSGFGYDPIFIPDGYKQTLAELGQDIKNHISHRRQALEQMKKWLAENEV